MGLRRCLFQIKRRKKDEKIRSINSGRGADTCFVGGVQKASTAEKQPAGGETTESQAENGGNEKKSTDAKLLKTSMPTAWDETHGYTQALIAMNAYLDEASGGRLQLDIYAGGQLGDEVSVFESMQMGTIDWRRIQCSLPV